MRRRLVDVEDYALAALPRERWGVVLIYTTAPDPEAPGTVWLREHYRTGAKVIARLRVLSAEDQRPLTYWSIWSHYGLISERVNAEIPRRISRLLFLEVSK